MGRLGLACVSTPGRVPQSTAEYRRVPQSTAEYRRVPAEYPGRVLSELQPGFYEGVALPRHGVVGVITWGYSECSCGVLCVRTRGTLSTHARLQNDQSETWLYRDMAASAMDALPNNSIVICQGRRQNNTTGG